MPKIKDICGRGRAYTAKDGTTKHEWIKVGRLIIQDDGNAFIAFEKWANPAGFVNEKGDVIFSVFEPKPKAEKDVPF